MNYIETIFEEENLDKTPVSFREIYQVQKRSRLNYWIYGLLIAIIFSAFLPWTQNIRSKAKVTTLQQENRPQVVNSAIGGRVAQWYVKEGDIVKAGDTLARLQETKVEYLDPQLLNRTRQQILAKTEANKNYVGKASTAGQQTSALMEALRLKVSQVQNKIQQTNAKVRADSADLVAARIALDIAKEQLKRQTELYQKGLVSLTQYEQRNQNFQNALAKQTSAEIKLMNTKQDLANLALELNGTRQEYAEKMSKVEGDRFQSLSQISSGEADIAKLENQFNNYKLRNDMYYILAPQAGQVTRVSQAGIGEIIKEGEEVLEIVPTTIKMAIEMFVKPMDIPLLQTQQKVRLIFDGYPAIIFSGWPQQSFGTFGGKVVAISNTVTTEGTFRILVAPDPNDRPWPPTLRFGTAADTFTLLKDVPIIYEIWRTINGFPPDYYVNSQPKKDKKG
jgi:multidrug resistance efflux pump